MRADAYGPTVSQLPELSSPDASSGFFLVWRSLGFALTLVPCDLDLGKAKLGVWWCLPSEPGLTVIQFEPRETDQWLDEIKNSCHLIHVVLV